MDKRPDNSDTLLLPAGQLAWKRILFIQKAQFFEHKIDFLFFYLFLSKLQGQHNIFIHIQHLNQVEILVNKSKAVPAVQRPLVLAHIRNDLPADYNASAVRRVQRA